MKLQKKAIISLGILALYVISIFSLAVASAQTTGSAIGVDADYITIFPGSEGKIDIDIENTNNFDIEDVSIELDLEDLPFTAVGSSTKDIDQDERAERAEQLLKMVDLEDRMDHYPNQLFGGRQQ